MSSVTEKIWEEFKKVLPSTIFFFIILHIIALIRSLMVRETGITPPTSASVLIASLILGKSVLIADMLPFINRFPNKPLVWNVSWKTLMYALVEPWPDFAGFFFPIATIMRSMKSSGSGSKAACCGWRTPRSSAYFSCENHFP